ncbi:MAG: esterase-like activity of phytase family protein [Pseudomonadota bacterium]
MTRFRFLPDLLAVAMLPLAAQPAAAQDSVPATLAGHAYLPAFSFSVPPADAPREALVSGKFLTADARVGAPYTVPARTGLATPFLGQPLQGFSAYAAERTEDGHLIALIDNGFGSKLNSSDALLSWTEIAPNFDTGETEIVDRIWLKDPDGHVPFRIVHEATQERYLTGADFDIESIQMVGDDVWIGEEFGPYLISATRDGVVTGVYPTELDGAVLRSPDHPALRAGAIAGEDYTVPRSGGYEGMALTEDGLLLAMLEKPLIAPGGESEGAFLRVIAFDPAARAWTGESFRFSLTPGASAIGDFNMIDATRALVIERDSGEGAPSLACAAEGDAGCFRNPAMVKRVTLVDLGQISDTGEIARLRQIDLMDIADPDRLARLETDAQGLTETQFVFPFVTIESVVRDGPEHILVSNDNNLPFSAGRRLSTADDNEIIRLHVPELLAEERDRAAR